MLQIIISLLIIIFVFLGGLKLTKVFAEYVGSPFNSNNDIIPSLDNSYDIVDIIPMYGYNPDEDGVGIMVPMYGYNPDEDDVGIMVPMYGYTPCSPYKKIVESMQNSLAHKSNIIDNTSNSFYIKDVKLTQENKHKIASHIKYNLFIPGNNQNWQINPISAKQHHPDLFIAPNEDRNVDTLNLCDGWRIDINVGLDEYVDIIRLNNEGHPEFIEANFSNYPNIFTPSELLLNNFQSDK